MLSCMVSKVFCKAYPVWQKAHAQTENLITGISADAMRDALRALA
jgi:hypothetical protein